MYDYDKLISYVGLSPYLIFLIFCTSIQIWPAGLNNMGPMFLMATPEYHAKQEWFSLLESSNCTEQYEEKYQNTTHSIHFAGLVAGDSNYDPCKLYNHDAQQLEAIKQAAAEGGSCQELFSRVDQLSHQFGSVNDTLEGEEFWFGVHKSGMTKTTATDFNLVCSSSTIATAVKSSYMAGFALGAMVFGPLSDNKGRKWVMQVTSVGAFLADVAVVFSVNIWMFGVARFIAATCISGLYVAAFTYAMEILQTKYRSFTGVNIQAQFAVGYMILGFMSLIPYFDDWRYFSAAITIFRFGLTFWSYFFSEKFSTISA